LTDQEPPSGPEESESAGGLGAFLNTTPRIIAGITALIGAVSGLLIALNKAGVIGSGQGGSESAAQVTTDDAAQSLFTPGPRGNGKVRFDNGKMYVTAEKPHRAMRVVADPEKSLQDVALSALVKRESGERDWGLGLICRFRDPRNYYLLGVTSECEYNIARYRDGKPRSLTGGLRTSEAINSEENRVRARCVGYGPTTLTLSVNGEKIASIQDRDEDIESGNVGLRVGSYAGVVTCSFDDLVLESL
jgi:hypothetical protein